MRRLVLLMGLAGVIGGLIATLPTLTAAATPTPPMTGSFTVSDFAFTAAGGGNTVTIAPGGTVSFSYPSGASEHNVDFGSGRQPTSCAAGGQSQSAPIPSVPTAPGWSGTCTFNTPGTYSFHCDRHTFMTGTIIVGSQATNTSTGSGGSTTSTDTMTMPMNMPMPTTSTVQPTTSTAQPTTGTSRPALLSPIAGSARNAIKVSGPSGGRKVDGSINVSRAGQGGHAIIAVISSSSALGRGGRKQPTTIGRLRLSDLRAGTVRFSVALKTPARRALTTHKQLAISVQVTVTAPGAQTVSLSRSLTLRA
jgi:plastocyanin